MAGGAGTRFWPLSTESRPKQFLSLFGQRSLLQLSHDRVAGLVPPERILVLTNQRFVPLVRQQLPELPQQNIIGEPMRRDTAAAVALAALLARHRFGNPVMAVLTADHLIEPVELFQRTLISAARAAAADDGVLYTFGIQPTYPATGYGYLERGEAVPGAGGDGVSHYALARFQEKPPRELAEKYLTSGRFYWNSGMFVWQNAAILAELQRQLPGHLAALEPALAHDRGPGWAEALERAFEPLQKESIDFGVMEKAERVRCVASTFEWSDVGGWLALEPFLAHDEAGNAHRGGLRGHGAAGNITFCEDEQEVVALVGVRDLVVVRTGRTTLVTDKRNAEAVKALVAKLDPSLK